MKLSNLKCVTPDAKWLKLWTVDFESKNGKTGTWSFVSRKDKPEVNQVSNDTNPDAVVIVAIVEDKGIEKLVITREFRIPLGDYEWGFPAGLVEKDEPIGFSIARELKEETGLDLSDVDRVSPPVYSSAGLTDESISYAFVWAKGNISNQFLKDGEDIETFLFTRSEASDLLNQKGLFKGAKMSAKLYPIISAWSVDGESYD